MCTGSAAAGNPQGAGAADFEDPHFVLVSNQQAFAAVDVTILFSQSAHDFNAFLSGSCTLQTQDFQVCNVEHTCAVAKVVGIAVPGELTDNDALLVHEGIANVEVGVSLFSLGDGAQQLQILLGSDTGVTPNFDHFTGFVLAALDDLDAVVIPAVTSVSDQNSAGIGSVLTDCHGGTCVGCDSCGGQHNDSHDQAKKPSHILHVFSS